MKTNKYNDLYDFCDSLDDAYEKMIELDFEKTIGILAKYEQAVEIIEYLICNGYCPRSVELSDPNYNGYMDEYYISIEDYDIFVEPMKKDGRYVNIEDTVVYVLDNCSSSVINHIDCNVAFEVGFTEDEDNGGTVNDETEIKANENELGKRTVDVFIVNGKRVTKEEYDAVEKEIMDEMSETKKKYEKVKEELIEKFVKFDDFFSDMLEEIFS